MLSRKMMFVLIGVTVFGFTQILGAQEELFKLDELVITGTKTEHILADVPVETVVITAEELEKINATSVIDALRWVAGIKASESFAPMAYDEYQMGGMSSDYTLVLVDGKRVKGRHVLSEIPVSSIERIEIVKGANSVLYGSDAMTGVINIITKPAPQKPTGSITLSARSHDSSIVEARFGAGKENLRFSLSGILKNLKGETELSRYESKSPSLKIEYDLSKDAQLKFDIRTVDEEKEFSETDKTDYDLSLDWDIDVNTKLRIGGYLNKYDDKAYPGGGPEATKEKSQISQGEVQFTHLFGERNLVTLGVEYLGEEMERTGFPEKKRQSITSVYLEDEIELSERLTLVPAARWDFHSRWGEEFNPKLSLLWKISEITKLRASAGKAFKSPTLAQMYRETFHAIPGPCPGFWINGNPDLEPEKSIGYRIGVEHLFNERLLANFALFRNEIEDMIEGYWVKEMVCFPPPGEAGEYSYRNIGKVRTQGAELELKKVFTDEITGTLAYTYLETEDKETGKELTYRPKNRFNAALRYYSEEVGFMAELRAEYEDKVYTDEENEDVSGSYVIFHLRLSKTMGEHAKVFVNVDNLFNKEEELRIPEGQIITGGITLSF